jgi:hypothetical protein
MRTTTAACLGLIPLWMTACNTDQATAPSPTPAQASATASSTASKSEPTSIAPMHPTDAASARLAEKPSSRDDPAVLRRDLLAILDARVDEMATKMHLDVRFALDKIAPIPYFGVDVEPDPHGILVTGVYAETGARESGLLKGDVLVKFGDVTSDSKTALAREVRRHRIGDVVPFQILRDGKTMTLSATLGPRPEEDEDEIEAFPDLIPLRAAPPAPLDFTFEDGAVGAFPAGLDSLLGGHGRLGAWRIIESGKGRALSQDDGDKTGVRYPMVIARDWTANDAVVRVRFRYAGGDIDRAAGVVLRFRDPGNYLVARANAAEGDLRIFRTVNGDRRTLPGAITKGATDDDKWHTLEFRVDGSQLTAILDGNIKATAQDTFFIGGRAGLWTKSDSRTEFDDLHVEALR